MAKPPQHPLRTLTQPAECRRRCQANIDLVGIFATFRNDRRPEAHAMTSPTTLQDFEAIELQGEETTIFLRRSGLGPAVLLLHGFPQTHLMWRSVAPLLAPPVTGICAHLPGFGPPRRAPSSPAQPADAKRGLSTA